MDLDDEVALCDVITRLVNHLTLCQLSSGYLFFNVDSRPRPSRETQWHLYRWAYPILRPVRSVGFARLPKLEFFHVYRKLAENSTARIAMVALYDRCRYNLLVSRAGQVVRDVKRTMTARAERY